MFVSNRSSQYKGWHEFSDERLESLKREIKQQSKDYILNINEAEYNEYLLNKYSFTLLKLYEENMDIQPPRRKEHELGERERFYISPYYWECSIACYVEGSTELWGIIPTSFRTGGRPEFAVMNSKITFQFTIQSQDAEEYNRQKNNALNYLKAHINSINNNAIAFNTELPNRISRLFSDIKNEYLKENSFFASINVTQNPDAPQTYSIPNISKRPVIQKPATNLKTYTVEPTIDSKSYHDIIDCLSRVGLSTERKPSLYVGKDEEGLRDLFLMQLELAFQEGTVTGETFNRSGKTDILLKNTDGTNLFIGECKVWKGAKHYLEAISQLLGYLTWDDSKAAIIIFVKTTNMSTVIQSVRDATLTHPSALKFIGLRNERFFQYLFKLPQDTQKHVNIEVMLFHYDKVTEGRAI